MAYAPEPVRIGTARKPAPTTLEVAHHELDLPLRELTDTAALSHSPLAIRRYLRGLREVYGNQPELEQLSKLAEQRQTEK